MTVDATPTPGSLLISPHDHVLLLIDHQSQMAFATKSIDATLLRTNVSLDQPRRTASSVSTPS